MGVMAVPRKAPNHTQGWGWFLLTKACEGGENKMNLEGQMEMTQRRERSCSVERTLQLVIRYDAIEELQIIYPGCNEECRADKCVEEAEKMKKKSK